MEVVVYYINQYVGIISLGLTVLLVFGAFKKNKVLKTIASLLLIFLNIRCIVLTSNGIFYKLYGVIVTVYAILMLYEMLTQKDERTYVIDEKTKITVDCKKVFQDNLKEATNGQPAAMYNLASFYSLGEGTTVNFARAKVWARKLAEYPDEFWSNEGKEILEIVNKREREYRKKMLATMGEEIVDKIID